jgi:hypothetical protein
MFFAESKIHIDFLSLSARLYDKFSKLRCGLGAIICCNAAKITLPSDKLFQIYHRSGVHKNARRRDFSYYLR